MTTLRANIVKAVKDPAAAMRWVRTRVLGQAPKAKARVPGNRVGATLEQRATEIRAAGHRRLAVHSDRAGFEAVRAALPEVELLWLSGQFAEAAAGARSLIDLVPGEVEAFLVSGVDAGVRYRQAVRWMWQHDLAMPAYWVSDAFEFCAGTLPVAAECSDADVDVFHHFNDFFGQRDPLLLRVEVFDQATTRVAWFVLGPKRHLRIRLSEWLPNRVGPACVYHYCSHPNLTSGRHYRWRATGHLYWGESVAMVHGDGDFRKGEIVTEHKVGLGGLGGGHVTITLPNYDLDPVPSDKAELALRGEDIVALSRRRDVRIDEARYEPGTGDVAYGRYFGVRFNGGGGSFWYAYDGGGQGNQASLSANHSVRGSFLPLLKRPATDVSQAFVEDLTAQGLILDPHCVPVEPDDSPVEFGFEFDMNDPILKRFNVRFYGHDGTLLAAGPFDKDRPGPIFAGTLVALFGLLPEQVQLAIVSPDWIGAGADPRGRGAAGNLVARLRRTGDYDATEFQNSWRNVGMIVPNLPHWLSQDRMLAGRTSVLCGVTGGSRRIGISCVNASGNMGYRDSAEVLLRLVDMNGREMQGTAEIGPFSHRMLWLDQIVPQAGEFLGDGSGTVILQSSDADLNANLITILNDRAVSLQHMWGY